MDAQILTQESLYKLFDYRNGELFWKTTSTKRKAGKKAGFLDSKGYWSIGINYKLYKAHRIIFVLKKGINPKEIDHIDGNPLNNRIENLREVSRQQNQLNRKIPKNNKTGFKNVLWIKKSKKWCVRVRVNGVQTYFGYYDDLELADLIATEVRDKYHREFANHG